MKSNKELFEEFRNYIAVTNLEYRYSLEKKELNVFIKKKIIISSVTCLILLSSVVVAFSGDGIINYFRKNNSRGLDKGIDKAIENGYIEQVDMDLKDQVAKIEKEKIIEDVYVGVKIDDFLMDDYNLSVKFSFYFGDSINEYINLNNLNDIKISDLYILDENNKFIYNMFNSKEKFEEISKKHELYIDQTNNNGEIINNGLNSFVIGTNKEQNEVQLQYNMYADKYPKSKQLNFYFSRLEFQENSIEEKVVLTGDWYICIDVPEKFYNRTEDYYKVVSSINKQFNVYTAKVTDTGFEFGMIIDGEKSTRYPEEVLKEEKRISDEYSVVDEETGIYTLESQNLVMQKQAELKNISPYKELIEQWRVNSHPIINSELYITDKSKMKDVCHLLNSNGERFETSLSPSRKYSYSFVGENQYDYYETYTMTKTEATDELTVVINYRGNKEEIKLEKIK